MLPASVKLDGLDISFDQYPPKEWLPSNISFITQDILAEPPPSLVAKYDIIHVQLFITILRDGNPVSMLQNLMKMLSEYLYLPLCAKKSISKAMLSYSCIEEREMKRRRLLKNS